MLIKPFEKKDNYMKPSPKKWFYFLKVEEGWRPGVWCAQCPEAPLETCSVGQGKVHLLCPGVLQRTHAVAAFSGSCGSYLSLSGGGASLFQDFSHWNTFPCQTDMYALCIIGEGCIRSHLLNVWVTNIWVSIKQLTVLSTTMPGTAVRCVKGYTLFFFLHVVPRADGLRVLLYYLCYLWYMCLSTLF